MMFDGLNTDGRCNVGFAGARAADQDDVLGTIHEFATMQLAHCGFIDLAGGKVEAGDVLVSQGEEDHRFGERFTWLSSQ